MNVYRKIVVGLMLFTSTAYGGVSGSLPEFANLRFERGSLVITTDNSPGQFVSKIGNKGIPTVMSASSDILVPLHETSLFYVRHLSLIFTPLEEGKGFTIERITDLRSVRRGLKEESFSLNIDPNGTLTFGEITVKGGNSSGGKIIIEGQSTPEGISKGDAQLEKTSAEDMQLGPEIAEKGLAATKSAADVLDKEGQRPVDGKLWWVIGVSGLAAVMMLYWIIKKSVSHG